jgi:uncharacterized protein DUF3311
MSGARAIAVSSQPMPRTRFRPYHLLALLPTLGLLGGMWFANRAEPFVLGLPFFLFWIVASVVATSAIMWVVWTLDRRQPIRGGADDDAAEEKPSP